VAAGVVPIAHAADGGGSIRIPAACCGLVGLKPSRGRLLPRPEISRMPVNIVVDGVLTRSVRDTALYFAEAEKRYRNPRLEPMGYVTTPPAHRLRVGALLDSPSGSAVDGVTRRTFETTVALLEDLGHRVEPMGLPVSAQFGEDFTHYYGLLAFAVCNAGKRLYDPSFDREKLTDLTHGLAALFRKRILRTPGALLRLRRSHRDYATLFERYDVVLSPTVGQATPPLGHLDMGLSFDVVFPRVVEWVGYTPLANATGAPAISLPLALDADKRLPVGMMFSAAHGKDGLLLQLAVEIEEARPWPSLANLEGTQAQS
jgi:amidase